MDTLRQAGTFTFRRANAHPWLAHGGFNSLWLQDFRGGVPTSILPREINGVVSPVWSPTDSVIAFGSCRDLTLLRVADRTTRQLQVGPQGQRLGQCRPTDWSSDGRYLILRRTDGIATYDLETEQVELIQPATSATEATLSADMRWLAFVMDESEVAQVFVAPFGRPGRPIRLSSAGGRAPRWRADGRELFFETPEGDIMSVAFPNGADAAFATGVPQATRLFRAPAWLRVLFTDGGTPYDVSPDGQRFVLRLGDSPAEAVLVQNWMSLLEKP